MAVAWALAVLPLRPYSARSLPSSMRCSSLYSIWLGVPILVMPAIVVLNSPTNVFSLAFLKTVVSSSPDYQKHVHAFSLAVSGWRWNKFLRPGTMLLLSYYNLHIPNEVV